MPTLSLTLIVKNEEVHIPRVLENARLFADEIVIVDTGSTDRTKEVASEYTDKIIDFEWCDDFAKARNVGLAACQMDYVMWLDADDVVERQDALRIRERIDAPKDWDVLYFQYDYARDRFGNTSIRQWRERIFDRQLGAEFEFPAHECLKVPATARIAHAHDIRVIHNNIRRNESSNARHLRILRKAVETDDYRNSFRMWWLLAREEAPEKAVLTYGKVLSQFASRPGFNPQLHGQVLYELGQKLFALKRWREALETFGKSAVLCPVWREPFFDAGKTLWMQHRYREALAMFNIAGTIPNPGSEFHYSLNPKIYDGEEFYEWLFITYHALNDVEKIKEVVAKGIRVNPDSARFQKRCLDYGVG